MKNKIYLIGLILSGAFGVITYYTTSSLICGIIVMSFSLFYFLFILSTVYSKYKNKVNRFHECYLFINNFIISLSIKSSLVGAFESVSSTVSDNVKDEIYKIKDLKEIEKLTYLISYFKFDDYRLFCDVVTLWMEEGGNILAMSNHVTNHIREIEEYINFSESKCKSKFLEFCLLWAFTIAILIVLKVVLNNFLSQMLKNMVFKVGVVFVFTFMLVSLQLFMMKLTNLEIGGWKDGKK